MRYRDTRTGATYEPRTEFAAAQMSSNPALVAECDDLTVDLASLTVATLRALCAERGVEAPKKATKAQLVELLS